MILGATKVDDSIEVASNVLANRVADRVVVVGVVANVFLLADGVDIGKPSTQLIQQLDYEKEVLKAREILEKYRERIVLPDEVAVREENHRAEYPIGKIHPVHRSLTSVLTRSGPSVS